MGSPYFASIGYASGLSLITTTDLPMVTGLHALHQFYHSLAGLPSCVTPSLGYYQVWVPRSPPPGPRRDLKAARAVSIT